MLVGMPPLVLCTALALRLKLQSQQAEVLSDLRASDSGSEQMATGSAHLSLWSSNVQVEISIEVIGLI